MVEILFSILAAIAAIVVAGFLVRRQEQYSDQLKDLHNQVASAFDEVTIEFCALTGKDLTGMSLLDLEQDMDALMCRLSSAVSKNHSNISRRKKHVKCSKTFTND